MTFFLDTCILIHSTSPFDKHYYGKASRIVNAGTWLTSNLVCEELRGIKERRERIYKNVLSYDHQKQTGKTLQEFYNNCFKSSLGSNKNDEKHLKRLFESCMEAINLKYNHTLRKETLEDFLMELHPKIQDIKVRLGKIRNDLSSPEYYKNHVVAEYYKSSACKPLKSDLYALQDAAQHEQDLLILIDAVAHSENENKKIDYVTTDAIYDKYRPDLEKLIKKHHPTAQIVIKHLNET